MAAPSGGRDHGRMWSDTEPFPPEPEPPPRGWHESSWDLRSGLEVFEHHWDAEALELGAACGF